jgi:hypothetical protein
MKRTDSRAHHVPEVDAELKEARRRCTLRRPTRVQLHGQPRPSEEKDLRAQEELDRRIERQVSEGRGLELVDAIEKVRRLIGPGAFVGVFLIAPDRERYDAINFVGQSEVHQDKVGPIKTLETFSLLSVALGYRVAKAGVADSEFRVLVED